VVSRNLVKVGEQVERDQPVTEVLQPRLRAELTLPKAYATGLGEGAIVQLSRAGGALLRGKIDKIERQGDKALLRVEVMDPAGAQANETVQLVRAQLQQAFVVPVAAVETRGSRSFVYVVQDGRARERTVTLADRDAREALVKSGLGPGDRVVTQGAGELVDGMRVEAP
jgi:hypothetical protein